MEYVTKDEFDKLKKEFNELNRQFEVFKFHTKTFFGNNHASMRDAIFETFFKDEKAEQKKLLKDSFDKTFDTTFEALNLSGIDELKSK